MVDGRSMACVSLNVAVGYDDVSMMRPWNWPSRRSLSLETLVRSTVTVAALTLDPAMVASPVTAVVRPTASLFWPNRISFTRYPACEPVVTFHGPSSWTSDPEPAAVVVPVWFCDERLRRLGALPSMKWMYT